jgi:ParB family transcriptional regulator, chromosome partitioning protein
MMKIPIDTIQVDEKTRIRKDIGDLKALETSIGEVGLINPILIDENKNLVSGYRRLSACKNLGWKEIEATVLTFKGDQLKKLEAEVAENVFRTDFTPEEIQSVEVRRREILESLRKKGIFERLWLWLKSLFRPKSSKKQIPGTETSITVQKTSLAEEPLNPQPKED